jgi:chromosomal replication initiator protein
VRAKGVVQDVTTSGTEIINDALHDALIQEVGQARYRLWFGPNTRILLQGHVLVVEAATPFFQDWLRFNFRAALERAATIVAGGSVEIEFRINSELSPESPGFSEQSSRSPQTAQGEKHSGTEDESTTPNSESKSSESKTRGSRLSPSQGDRAQGDRANALSSRNYSDFETFVVGHCNRVANASACMVAENPGCLTPLYLYGGTGLGKTHLLESIWTAVFRKKPDCRALFLGAEQFTSLFLEALHHSGLPNFRRKYRNVELLILDDIQFFSGKKATMSELLHTVESLLRHGRQVVLAADRPPVELEGLPAELVSRFSGGMVCKLLAPDHPTRREIVRRYVNQQEFEISAEVQELVALRLTDGPRELFGALNRLHATSLAVGTPLALGAAEDALADLILPHGYAVRLPDIEKAVCDTFGLEPESLRSYRKVKSISHPRMLAMWLARKHTRNALSEIGDYFGKRSHATVISAQKRVTGWMARGDSLQMADQSCQVEDAIRRVEERIRAG